MRWRRSESDANEKSIGFVCLFCGNATQFTFTSLDGWKARLEGTLQVESQLADTQSGMLEPERD